MTSKSELPMTQMNVTHSQFTCMGGETASSTGSDMLMPTGVPVATQAQRDVGKTAERIAQSDQEAAITAPLYNVIASFDSDQFRQLPARLSESHGVAESRRQTSQHQIQMLCQRLREQAHVEIERGSSFRPWIIQRLAWWISRHLAQASCMFTIYAMRSGQSHRTHVLAQ